MTQRHVYSAFLATFAICSAPVVAQMHDHSAKTTVSAQHSMHSKDDASYVRMMRMHHEQGVKMAKLAVERAQRQEVRQFAQKTLDEQQQDIGSLQRIAEGQSTAAAGTGAHEHGAAGTSGAAAGAPTQSTGAHDEHMKMGQQMLSKLEQASGASFDREFLRNMAQHHKMAIDMSKPAGQFKSDEVRQFAAALVKKQTAELKEIQTLQQKEQ